MQKLTFCLISLLVAISAYPNSIEGAAKKSYDGYKLYSITLETKQDCATFSDFKETLKTIDTWKDCTMRPNSAAPQTFTTQVMVSLEESVKLEDYLKGKGFPFVISIPNVGTLIQEEAVQNARAKQAKPRAVQMTWDAYYTFDEVMDWFDELCAANSDIATVSTIGKSFEGRDLKMVKISKPGSPANKNSILIDGGFHAREWISPAIVTYILNELLNKTDQHTEVLDAVDIYIIPFVNADGYAFTHADGGDRMWRKTRQDHGGGPDCLGVDPNRNFDFHFGGPGTSNSTCSETYHGPAAYSEPETAALRDILTNKNINFVSYLTLHSFGQMWLTPWSWTDDLPEDMPDLMKFAWTGVSAMYLVDAAYYEAGATTFVLGSPTSGCSDDWAKAVAGIKYANTIEVRDLGEFGFVLPPTLIEVTANETWAGIRAVCLFEFDTPTKTETTTAGSTAITVMSTTVLLGVFLAGFKHIFV